jgi:predicted AAA+ superfamily ATPase
MTNKTTKKYMPRVFDVIVKNKLSGLGGLIIEGPKWCGKTSTAEQFAKSAVYMDDLDDDNNIRIASLNPAILLNGDTPRLIDEWQLAPFIFDTVRREIDRRGAGGQFILTGSSTPPLEKTKHTGTGRYSYVRMQTMSLFESSESNGSVSLSELFEGNPVLSEPSGLTIENLAFAIIRGGWPGSLSMEQRAAKSVAGEYLASLERSDFVRSDDKRVKRNPEKIKALIRSYAKNTATPATVETIMSDVEEMGVKVSRATIDGYVRDLKGLYVTYDQPAWSGELRSRTPLRQTPKRHLADPSLAAAAIGATTEKLLLDFNTMGFLFESLCVRDVRVYGSVADATVYHYRDKIGLEADIVIERADGRWAVMEVKLGSRQEEEAAANLKKVVSKIDTTKKGEPDFLAIITATKYPFRREDGIYVIPIGCLGS